MALNIEEGGYFENALRHACHSLGENSDDILGYIPEMVRMLDVHPVCYSCRYGCFLQYSFVSASLITLFRIFVI